MDTINFVLNAKDTTNVALNVKRVDERGGVDNDSN